MVYHGIIFYTFHFISSSRFSSKDQESLRRTDQMISILLATTTSKVKTTTTTTTMMSSENKDRLIQYGLSIRCLNSSDNMNFSDNLYELFGLARYSDCSLEMVCSLQFGLFALLINFWSRQKLLYNDIISFILHISATLSFFRILRYQKP